MKKLLVFILTFLLTLTACFTASAAETDAETLAEDALVYEGIAARLKGDAPGIRSLYTVDMAKVRALEAVGYTVHFGAMMGIASYQGTPYTEKSDYVLTYSAEDGKFNLAGGKSIARVCVYAGDGAPYATEKYVRKVGDSYTFAYTTTYDDNDVDLYHCTLRYAAYIGIVDGNGNATVFYDYAEGPVFGETTSLYNACQYFSTDYSDNAIVRSVLSRGSIYEYTDFTDSAVTLYNSSRILTAYGDSSRTCLYMPSGSYLRMKVNVAAEGFYGIGVKFANDNNATSGSNFYFLNRSLSGAYSVNNAMRVKKCVGDTLESTELASDGTSRISYSFPKTDIAYQGAGNNGESAYAGYVYMTPGENEIEIAASNISLTVSAIRFFYIDGNTDGSEGAFLTKPGQEAVGHYGASITSSTNVARMTGNQYIDWSFTVARAGEYRFGGLMAHFLQQNTNAFEVYLLSEGATSGADFLTDKTGATLVGSYDKSLAGYVTSNTVSTSDRAVLNYMSLATFFLTEGTHTVRLYQTGGVQPTAIGYVALTLVEPYVETEKALELEGTPVPQNGAVYAADEKTVYIGNGSVSNGYTNYPYASVTVNADVAGMYAVSAKYIARTNDATAGHTDLFIRNISAPDGAAGCIYGGEYVTEAGGLADYSVPAERKSADYPDGTLAYVYLVAGENTLHIFNHSNGNVGLYGVKLSLVSETADASAFVMAKDYVAKSKGGSQHSYIEPNKVLEFRATYLNEEGYAPFYADYTVTIPENGYYRLSAQLGTNQKSNGATVGFYDVTKDASGNVTSSSLLASCSLTEEQYRANFRSTCEITVGTVYMSAGTYTIRYKVESMTGILTMMNFRFDKLQDLAYTIEEEGTLSPENGAVYAADEKTVYIGNGSVSNGYTNYPYASVTVNADVAGMYAVSAKYIARTNDATAGHTDLFIRNISAPDGAAGCIYGGEYVTEAGGLADYSVPEETKNGDYSDTPVAYVYLVAGENTLHIFNHSNGNVGLYGVRLRLSSRTTTASAFVMAKDYVAKSKGGSQHSYIEPNKVLEFRATYLNEEGYAPFYADYTVTIPENGYYRLSAQLGTNQEGGTSVGFYDVVKDGSGNVTETVLLRYTLQKNEKNSNYRATDEADLGYVYMEAGTHTIRYKVESMVGILTMLNFRFDKEDPEDHYTVVYESTEDTLLLDAVTYLRQKVAYASGDTLLTATYDPVALPGKYIRLIVDETMDVGYTLEKSGGNILLTAGSTRYLACVLTALADEWTTMENEMEGEVSMSDEALEALSALDVGYSGYELTFLCQNLKSGDYADATNPYTIQNRSLLLRELIKANDADLIAVQEVNKKWINILTADYSDTYGFVFGVSRNGTSVEDASDDSDEFGGILYRLDRFTLVSSGTFWLHSETPSYEPGKNESSNWPRICTYAELRDNISGKTVLCMSTHLDESSETARVEEAEPLVAFIKDYEEKNPEAVILIAGDFNTTRNSTSYNAFTEVLAEVVPNVLSDESDIHYTYHNFGTAGGTSEIDFIFYSEQTVRPLTYRVINDQYGDDASDYVSDHYGIVAELGV